MLLIPLVDILTYFVVVVVAVLSSYLQKYDQLIYDAWINFHSFLSAYFSFYIINLDDDHPKCISGYHTSFDFILFFLFLSFFATYLEQKKRDLFFLFKLCAYFIEFMKTKYNAWLRHACKNIRDLINSWLICFL